MAINLNDWIENVDAAKSATPDQISDAVKGLQTRFRTDEKTKGQRIIAAAYATKAALDAKTHSKADLSRTWDKDASTITLYSRLGKVAFDLGILPKQTGNHGNSKFSDDVSVWTMLAGKAGATISYVGQYIEKGAVTEYKPNDKGEMKPVYDGNPTAEGLVDVLTDYFKPNGEKEEPKVRKVNAQRREAAIMGVEYVEAESDSGSGDGQPDSGDQPTRTVEARFGAAVTDITALAEELSSENWAKFQQALRAMNKALSEKAAFEKKAAAAAKKAS